MGNYVVFFFLATIMKLRFVVVLSLLSGLSIGNCHAMTFSAPKHELAEVMMWENDHPGRVRIYADGEITNTTVVQFNSFVKENKIKSAMVMFNSGGGSLFDGIRLGSSIRSLGFDTSIATYSNGKTIEQGICASACAYAFAGGVGRYYSGGGMRLGIHQFYSSGKTISNQASQETSGLIVAHLQKMGVDAFAFAAASFTAKESMLWLTVKDAEELQFANNGAFPTTAELKQSSGATYLKIEQVRVSEVGRLLFFCIDKQISLGGGIVTTEEDAKNKNEWATQTYFSFDYNTVQLQRRTENPKGFTTNGSVSWVTRTLSNNEINQLMATKLFTVGVGGDGAMAYIANVDISKVKSKIGNFVNNCTE